MNRERIKELTVRIEDLLKSWHYTRCDDKQSEISTSLQVAANELQSMGVKSVYAEDSNGNLGNLNVKTLMFER